MPRYLAYPQPQTRTIAVYLVGDDDARTLLVTLPWPIERGVRSILSRAGWALLDAVDPQQTPADGADAVEPRSWTLVARALRRARTAAEREIAQLDRALAHVTAASGTDDDTGGPATPPAAPARTGGAKTRPRKRRQREAATTNGASEAGRPRGKASRRQVERLMTQAVRLYAQGQYAEQIGATLGQPARVVRGWLRERDVPRRGHGNASPALRARAVELYQQGRTAEQVAAELGYSDNAVYKWLNAAAVRRRRRGRHVDPAIQARAVELYRQGRSIAQVSGEVGYSETAVRNWLKRHNVPRRHTGRGVDQPPR
uniref:helix-turn-helix domain-containing protein n=1 Tax=Actinokineospora sp. CA-119265 TaxID=3239890 RepID=UPI003F493C7B